MDIVSYKYKRDKKIYLWWKISGELLFINLALFCALGYGLYVNF